MRASDFEYRHQSLIHQFLVAAAFLTYFVQYDDIVWHFVKDSARAREFERSIFALATLLIAVGSSICTWARGYRRPEAGMAFGPYRYFRHPQQLGEVLYALGLGSLVPLWGFVILVVGEAVRVIRLIRREDDHREKCPEQVKLRSGSPWARAFRQEAVKWGVLLTMIVFVFTLRDRIAEILLVLSLLVGLICDALVFSHSPNPAAAGNGD